MDKAQAIDQFWNSFSIPAYDENTVPFDAVLPYITYSVRIAPFDMKSTLTASIWYPTYSWKDVTNKADEISEWISRNRKMDLDNGYLWFNRDSFISQRMADSVNPPVRRIYVSVDAEFLTEY